jgi:uncharacterized membrane protein
MVQQSQTMLFSATAALWQAPLAEVQIPWWVWLLVVGIMLVVIFIFLVLVQAPGAPLENPNHKDETDE